MSQLNKIKSKGKQSFIKFCNYWQYPMANHTNSQQLINRNNQINQTYFSVELLIRMRNNNSKDHLGSSQSIPNQPKLLFSFNNKVEEQLENFQIASPTKLQSVNETVETMNLVPKRRNSQFSVSPTPKKSPKGQDEQSSSRADSIGPSNGSTIYDEAASRYQCIAQLTEQQNVNLKQQNAYLIEKLRKMQDRQSKIKKLYEKAKKYKTMYQQAQIEIEMLQTECQIYKEQAEQMKKIVLTDVYRLKQKVMQTQITNQESQDFEQQKHGKSQIKSQGSTENKSSQSSLNKYLKPDADQF